MWSKVIPVDLICYQWAFHYTWHFKWKNTIGPRTHQWYNTSELGAGQWYNTSVLAQINIHGLMIMAVSHIISHCSGPISIGKQVTSALIPHKILEVFCHQLLMLLYCSCVVIPISLGHGVTLSYLRYTGLMLWCLTFLLSLFRWHRHLHTTRYGVCFIRC